MAGGSISIKLKANSVDRIDALAPLWALRRGSRSQGSSCIVGLEHDIHIQREFV